VTKGLKPVWHLLEARDGTGIITEENATERSKTGLLWGKRRMSGGEARG
jgi:hypothetical protein